MVKEKDKYGIGKRFATKEGCKLEIIGKLSKDRRRVRFEGGYETDVCCSHIRTGKIKNPYHHSVYEIGFVGIGEYGCMVDGKNTPEYSAWNNMLRRCYYDKTQEKNPTYKNVKVCDEWLNFQIFARWYEINYPKINNISFDLDKDLLQQNVESKIYSPENCIFLPHKVNTFLTNKQLNNTSGYIGVYWDKINKKWTAQITLFGEGKTKHLGRFPTPEQASLAYQEARAEQAEKAKEYLRSLNYLSEEIINLIK